MKLGIAPGLPVALAAAATHAHEADRPHAEAAATASSARVRFTAAGQLIVPAAVQRRLGIRAAPMEAATVETVQMPGEVLAHPDSPGRVLSPLAGRIEPAAGGRSWPLADQAVKSGETLAILHPQISAAERAKRGAALALIDQRLNVARINVGRMRTQADAMECLSVEDNIYLEQAEAELATQQRLRALAVESLESRIALRARGPDPC